MWKLTLIALLLHQPWQPTQVTTDQYRHLKTHETGATADKI
jgi:hypothetical protein